MPDADPPDSKQDEPSGASELRGLDPGELLARAMDTAKPSAGAAAWEPPTPEALGLLLPQYRIQSLIGRGGMGAVYKGTQVVLDRPVAIKLLPAEVAADGQFVARFHREARTLARLQHSRIITIHDFGQTSEGHLYFVMEYIDGTNLREILRGPGLNPDQALLVVAQICDALQAAHAQGVIHRDIKPENILVTKDGYVKLADFGLARPLNQEDISALTGTHVIMGTADYMAPEQREGQTDERADIFALGVMLYEMLTGKPPRGAFEPASRKMRLDVRIDEVVLKALQAAPERRYQRVSDMKTDVDRIRNTPQPQPQPAPAGPTGKPAAFARIKRWTIAGAAAALAVLLILTLFHFSGHKRPSVVTEIATPSTLAESSSTAALGELHGDSRISRANPPIPSPQTTTPSLSTLLAQKAASVHLTAPAGEDEGVSLFNGKDLSGWVGRTEYWSVEDGAITGILTKENTRRKYTSLIWNGGEVSDFELTCKFKIRTTGDGSVHFTRIFDIMFRGWLAEKEYYSVGGYRATISAHQDSTGRFGENQFGRRLNVPRGQKVIIEDGDPKTPTIRVVGRLASEKEFMAAMAEDDWNQYRIVAVGNHIELFVNGIEAVDAIDEGSLRRTSGLLALQLFWNSMVKVQFKDIKLKRLTSDRLATRPDLSSHSPKEATPPPPSADNSSSMSGGANETQNFVNALLANSWTWNGIAPELFPWKKIMFSGDGTATFWAEGKKTTGAANPRWIATGSRSATLQLGAGDQLLLTFDEALHSFTGRRPNSKPVVEGARVLPANTAPIAQTAPGLPARPSFPVIPTAKPAYGSHQEEALLGSTWSWDTVNEGPHTVIQFLESGEVARRNATGWHWQWLPKPNSALLVDCFWREQEHLYLKFNKEFDEFSAYDGHEKLIVTGRRLTRIGAVESSAPEHQNLSSQPPPPQPLPKPSPPKPAGLREALVNYKWSFNDHGHKDHFECRFMPDGGIYPGIVHWEITGPHNVKIWWLTPGNIADLTFNGDFTSFVGTARDPINMPHSHLHGERLDPVDRANQ